MYYFSKIFCVFVNSSVFYGFYECLGSVRVFYEFFCWYVIILCFVVGFWVIIYVIFLEGGYVLFVLKFILVYLFL